MALTERRILKQVSVLPELGAVNVQWSDQVLRDDVVIAETLFRRSYDKTHRDAFLSEVEGASAYLSALAWP